MCDIIFYKEETLWSPKNLLDSLNLEESDLVMDENYKILEVEACLCQIDLEKTFSKADIQYTINPNDSMEFTIHSVRIREATKEELQKELGLDPNYKERPLEPDWRPMQESIDKLVIERDKLLKENLELKERLEKLLDKTWDML